jgi:hypothetical protein
MKLYFHCPSIIPEIENVFDPENPERTTVSLRVTVEDSESGYLDHEDTIYLDEDSRMEYITSPNSFRVKGILIHVHPLEKDYPEDPATVEVEECIINLVRENTFDTTPERRSTPRIRKQPFTISNATTA